MSKSSNDPKDLMTLTGVEIDKLDNIKKEKFVEFYARDEVRGNVSVTCSAVGISRQTYYDWLEKDETFRNIIKDLKMSMCDDMEQVLVNRAVDKSDTALIYWLKYNHPQYKEKSQVVQQFNVGGESSKNEIVFVNFKNETESK